MRIAWSATPLVTFVMVAAGCFGPYAADLEPEGPPATESSSVAWRFAAGTTDTMEVSEPLTPPTQRLTGFQGAEPNIGITSTGSVFVTAFDDTIRFRDGQRLWEKVYSFEPTLGTGGTETGDPMLWVDPVTDIVYTNHMFPSLVCFATSWSNDDGDNWDSNEASCTLPGVDHQKFFSAPPGPLAPAIAGMDHPTVLFQCSQKVVGTEPTGFLVSGFTTHCNMSYDGGLSWPAETVAATRIQGAGVTATCGGINGHPAAAPDGTIAVPITLGCDGLYVAVSQDSGLTWTNRPGPKDVGAVSIDPELAFSPDGTLYALWRGSDQLPYLARSPDQGLTWAGPWRVSAPNTTTTVFQALSAGADGRIGVAFLGTDDASGDPSDAGPDTVWHLFVGSSDDADAETPTITLHQVTDDEDPVQRGCVWLRGGGNPCRNMLDFIDSAVHPDGTFYVAYTDGCIACVDDKSSVVAVSTLPGFDMYGGAT